MIAGFILHLLILTIYDFLSNETELVLRVDSNFLLQPHPGLPCILGLGRKTKNGHKRSLCDHLCPFLVYNNLPGGKIARDEDILEKTLCMVW
jgi:hypothetical protein